MDEQEYLLLVTMHHSIGDGWSLGVLAHELAVLYDAFSEDILDTVVGIDSRKRLSPCERCMWHFLTQYEVLQTGVFR